METHLQNGFQLFVNGNIFERVILMKWLSIYLLLKHGQFVNLAMHG